MKKGAIITAIILISAGILIFVGGLFAGGGLKPLQYETKSYSVADPFTGICIDTHEMDIQLIPSSDGTCSVACAETEKLHVNVSVEEGVLKVVTVDERTWVDRLMPHADQPLQIFLPQTAYDALSVESRTGDVQAPGDFTFARIQIRCSTGDVACAAPASGPIEITTSTGAIAVDSASAESLTLSVTTGRVAVRGTTVKGDVNVTVSTGRLLLSDVRCKNLVTNGNTGDVTMERVLVEETISVKRSTGDVSMTGCDAKELTVETDTGDVTGSLLSSKIFFVKSDTGKIDVPETTSGGNCRITTDTGDIRITLP